MDTQSLWYEFRVVDSGTARPVTLELQTNLLKMVLKLTVLVCFIRSEACPCCASRRVCCLALLLATPRSSTATSSHTARLQRLWNLLEQDHFILTRSTNCIFITYRVKRLPSEVLFHGVEGYQSIRSVFAPCERPRLLQKPYFYQNIWI